VSIDFHERGKKHQTNVAKSLREAREKGVKKQDAEEKLMQDLDAIEKAAMRSFEKDMARDISLSSRDTSYHSALVQRKKKTWDEDDRRQQADKDRREAAIIASAIARTHAVLPQPGEGEKKEQGATPKPPPPPNPWSKVTSSDGLTYYHNAITKESRWDKPPELDDPSTSQCLPQPQTATTTAVAAGSKRQVEQPAEDKTGGGASHPKRSSGDVYGSWTTVATRERTTDEGENPHKRLYMTEEDDSEEDDEEEEHKGKIRFREKTFGSSGLSLGDTESSQQTTSTSFKGFGFKKKGQANMRKRNLDL
jgi:WW domain-binding protein 4